MSLFRHIMEKLKNRDNLWFILLFALFGIVLAFEEKSIYPILFLSTLCFIAIIIYAIFTGIKSWRFESDIRKLTPEQTAQLFGDIVNQAQWDPDTKDALEEIFDKDKVNNG